MFIADHHGFKLNIMKNVFQVLSLKIYEKRNNTAWQKSMKISEMLLAVVYQCDI